VCFFHPNYDIQGHIIPTLNDLVTREYAPEVQTLTRWLRCSGPQDFQRKAYEVNRSRDLWVELVTLQHELFKAALKAQKFLTLVDDRLMEIESRSGIRS
jgi:hypothetical protein